MPSRRWRSVASSQCGRPTSFFVTRDEMRREDHAAGVAGPMLGIERGVVLRQERIAGVAEDALHEIEIADETARREEADLHRLLRDMNPGTSGQTTGRSSSETKHSACALLRRGEGQPQQFARRLSARAAASGRRRGFGTAILSPGIGQAALGDVENPLRRAAVALRIVQHALLARDTS